MVEARQFNVTMNVKRQIVLVVEAKNEAEARAKAEKWDAVDQFEQEQLDLEIICVREAKRWRRKYRPSAR